MPHIYELDWSKHQHIGLDLDETLAATVEGFLEFSHSRGLLLDIPSIDDIHSHDLSAVSPQVTREQGVAMWEAYGRSTLSPESIPAIESAIEGTKKLSEIGKTLSVVTARNNLEKWKVERTVSWIETHFPMIDRDRVYFVNHFSTEARPKSHACKDCGITLMVDDAIENIDELSHNSIDCILLEKPWNRDWKVENPYIYRAKDWTEIITSLKI